MNGMLHPAKKKMCSKGSNSRIFMYGTPCAQRIVVIQARDTMYVKIVCVYLYVYIRTKNIPKQSKHEKTK